MTSHAQQMLYTDGADIGLPMEVLFRLCAPVVRYPFRFILQKCHDKLEL